MDSQDTGTLFLFKLWAAIEANKTRIAVGAAVIIAVILGALFFSWQKDQKEVTAGEAYSQALVNPASGGDVAGVADSLLKVADQYPGTEAAQRAELQAAADLFTIGKYADAQTQFQKFADANPNSAMIAAAELGIASSLEAQGKTDAALDAYKNVFNNYADVTAQLPAKFAVARISKQQGKVADAFHYFDEVARVGAGTSLGQQAGLIAAELKATMSTATPSFAPGATTATPVPLNK